MKYASVSAAFCLSLLAGIAQADSLNCRLVGHCDTPNHVRGVAITRIFDYVAAGTVGLRVISVADPGYPVEVGYEYTPVGVVGVAVAGSYVFVADGYSGLQVIEFYGGGVEETPSAEVRTVNGGPTILSGASGVLHPASSSTRWAGGVLSPKSGIYFVKDEEHGSGDVGRVRKVVVVSQER